MSSLRVPAGAVRTSWSVVRSVTSEYRKPARGRPGRRRVGRSGHRVRRSRYASASMPRFEPRGSTVTRNDARYTEPAAPLTWKQKLWREVRGYAEALVIAYLVVTFVFTTVGVVGTSMEPNLNGGDGRGNVLQALLTGDRVFIPKFDTWLRRAGVLGEYERGAVVVLREPANAPNALLFGKRNFFIKRVIGLPGDRVRIEAGQ